MLARLAITATKAADTNYNKVTVSYTLNIAKIDQAAFDFANAAVDKTFGDPVFTFTPTGGSGAGSITYESSEPAVATISGTSGEVTIKGAGTTTITTTKAADTNYNKVTASYILTVEKAEQATFTFASMTVDKTFGDPVFTFTPTGGSGAGAITYESGDTAVATVVSPSGEVTIKGAGTTTITATNVATNYNAAATTYTLSVAKADQAAFDFASTVVDKTFGDPVFTQPAPTGGSGTGEITWESGDLKVASVSGTSGEVTIKGAGTTTITATKAADTNYNAETARYTLNIAKIDQAAFDFANAAVDKIFGDPVFTFTPTGGSGTGAITYESDDTKVATVVSPDGEVTIKGVGTITITVTKAADANYNVATASYTLNIAKANQAAFTFADAAVDKTVGDADFIIAPTGGSGDGAITYESNVTAVATVVSPSGEVTIVGIGETTITATKAADTNYNEVTASYTLNIAKAAQAAFDFASTTVDKTFGDTTFTQPAPTGGTGTGAITWESSDPAVASVSATSGEVTIITAGTTTITATKAADTNYNEATASYTLNIAKAAQAAFDFAFTTVDKTFGDTTFTQPAPTGGTGTGAITYESRDLTVATISATSGEVTIVSVGTTTITATKAGDATYNEATASYTLYIAKANQAAFTFATPVVDMFSFGDAAFTITPTGGSGIGGITYLSTDPKVATIAANTGEVTIVGIGRTIITATKAGDTTYHPAPSVSYRLIIDYDNNAFVTTWEVEAGSEITIPTNGDFTYSYTVDWGDNSADTTTHTGDATHTYTNADTYTVSIVGTFPSIYFDAFSPDTNSRKIKTIKQWGNNPWKSMSRAFQGCEDLTIEKTAGNPDLSNVTNMSSMFDGASTFNQDISEWDVRNVTNMSFMFFSASAFDQDISEWDVRNVTNMSFMFEGASTFNQDISEWNVSKVTNMVRMFRGVTLSTENYDALLRGWRELPLQMDVPVTFHGGNSKYCDESARDILVNTYNWSITDDGKDAEVNCRTGQELFTFDSPRLTKGIGDAAFTITPTGGSGTGGITYQSDAPNVATIAANTGEVTITGDGKTTITATKAGGTTYYPATASYTLTIEFDFDNAFVTTWEVDAGSEITIPTNSAFTYSYTVDWGDSGADTTTHTGDATHKYAAAGIYTVSISGTFPSIYFPDPDIFSGIVISCEIKTIEQWGNNPWKSMNRAFYGCEKLTTIEAAAGNPVLSTVTDMSYMFSGTAAFNQDISGWEVGTVTDMSDMFNGASTFNQDISGWDVSKVTNMHSMFEDATAFNQDLNEWGDKTSKVTNMSHMFEDAAAFNQDIKGWDVSKVTRMEAMFQGATAFDQDLSGWVVSKVEYMHYMFRNADAFDQDLSGWDVSKVKNMIGMFLGATAFDQDLSGWDVSNVTTMSYMFSNATAFDQDLSGWDVSNVTTMSYMFEDATLSTANYDALLLGWSKLTLRRSVTPFPFHGGSSKYCLGAAAEARNKLTSMYNWNITDGGDDKDDNNCLIDQEFAFASATLTKGIGDAAFTYLPTSSPGTGVITYHSSDTSVATIDANGEVTITGGGETTTTTTTTTITATKAKDTTYFAATASYTLTITIDYSKAFVTTWEVEAGSETTIPTNPDPTFAYRYVVDWGDNSAGDNIADTIIYTGDATHTYTNAGSYTVSIVGTFPSIYFADPSPSFTFSNDFSDTPTDTSTDDPIVCKIKTIKKWGNNPWKSMNGAFRGCENLTIEAEAGNPDLSKVTDMSYMFDGATAFNQDISEWEVGTVTDMSYMFDGATAFNQDISEWEVGTVTNMSYMFNGARAFNQDIGGWNVSNVETMFKMFAESTVFNQDLSGWDVSKVRVMGSMFAEAATFNQDIGWDVRRLRGWNVLNVTDMSYMFGGARAFNQDIGGWDVRKVRSMKDIFNGVTLSRENYDALLLGWSALPTLVSGVLFHGGNSTYCNVSARMILEDRFKWEIEGDGGEDDRCPRKTDTGTAISLPLMFADDAAIASQTYPADESITTLILPEASGGVGTLAYSLTIPVGLTFDASTRGGLTFDASTRTLSGTTPDKSVPRAPLIYTVTDSATPTPNTVTLDFTITVVMVMVSGGTFAYSSGAIVANDVGGNGAGNDNDMRLILPAAHTVTTVMVNLGTYTQTPQQSATEWCHLHRRWCRYWTERQRHRGGEHGPGVEQGRDRLSFHRRRVGGPPGTLPLDRQPCRLGRNRYRHQHPARFRLWDDYHLLAVRARR